jgi:hypothetical protein
MKTCEQCGRSFAAQRSTARYCTDGCRQKAYRERHAMITRLKRIEDLLSDLTRAVTERKLK